MRATRWMSHVLTLVLAAASGWVVATAKQDPVQNPAQQQDPNALGETVVRAPAANPDITAVVARLELEKYKATIKGLTQFGDRRQGTKRNRDAADWIEAQLKSYGCADVSRLHYTYAPPPRGGGAGAGRTGAAGGAGRGGAGGAGRAAPPAQGEPVRTGPGGSTEF